MTDTVDAGEPGVSTDAPLTVLRLPELQAMATELGVRGTSKMRKGDLVAAIGAAGGEDGPSDAPPPQEPAPAAGHSDTPGPAGEPSGADQPSSERLADLEAALDARLPDRPEHPRRNRRSGRGAGAPAPDQPAAAPAAHDPADQPAGQNPGQQRAGDDEERGGRRRRSRDRYRDRKRGRGRQPDITSLDEVEIGVDDVLVPVAGILDVLDSYAFVRTSGYLPGPHDVYVSLGQVKKSGLRRGDAITGAVRAPREGDPAPQGNRPNKFNALVRLD
ncbi:MAG: Rho termination factor N-terminal domain-containing protein, partial [Micrococcales bacterium]|nr:Rho termination factor N-terminal domain-containing protein [Micrococcales bacterium]